MEGEGTEHLLKLITEHWSYKFQEKFHPAAGRLARNSCQGKGGQNGERHRIVAVRIHLYIKHEQKYCRLNAINCWTASFSTTGRREEYSFVSAVVKSVLSAILPTNAKHGTSGAAIPARHSTATHREALTEPGCVVFISQEKCTTRIARRKSKSEERKATSLTQVWRQSWTVTLRWCCRRNRCS